jgi:co-chaperonin GroES (HSP10)
MQGGLRVLGDRILVRRSDGVGEEVTLPSGIVLPANREASVQTKGELFRARVVSMGAEAKRQVPDLAEGAEVFVYAYSGTAASVFTGDSTPEGLFIKPDDIACVIEEAA